MIENIQNKSKRSPEDKKIPEKLTNLEIPDISLQSSNGEYVQLRRKESFKIVLYCYPMTGRPDRALPNNWNNIKGASGCTAEAASFRDKYDQLIKDVKIKNNNFAKEHITSIHHSYRKSKYFEK